ncbi:hypothetical protein P20652_0243 [Pseudoalteromonas sp. BSi20652]|nr:hypothetical protein P20652_0243 [Pseudoalteromonas sp. BSi20652]
MLVLLVSTNSFAVEKEYMLKAGFLYNFARFSQWQNPLDENTNFTLCSPDKNFVDIADTALNNRTVKGLPLVNKYITLDASSIKQCNMIFITSDTFEDWIKTELLIHKNILVVGENDEFIESSGHIRFFLSSGKIRFEIAPQNLKSDGITMSSKVLRLARVVGG